jgi:hypothetical protein
MLGTKALSLVILPPGLRSQYVISNRAWLAGLYDRIVGWFGFAKVHVNITFVQFGDVGNGKGCDAG